jgi:hypothetical protein
MNSATLWCLISNLSVRSTIPFLISKEDFILFIFVLCRLFPDELGIRL